MSSPSYWSICVGGVAGAIRRLCQLWLFVSVIRADTELFYCSSLHLLPVDEWQRTAQILKKKNNSCLCCLTSPLNQRWISEIFLSLMCTLGLFFPSFYFIILNCGTYLKCPQDFFLFIFFFLIKSNNVKAFNGKGNISWWGTGGVVPLLL